MSYAAPFAEVVVVVGLSHEVGGLDGIIELEKPEVPKNNYTLTQKIEERETRPVVIVLTYSSG